MRPALLALTGLAFALFGLPAARADVAEAVRDHAQPGYAGFAQTTGALAAAAATDCSPAGLQPAFHTAQEAWMGVAHLHLGPAEEGGLSLAIFFWPDAKGSGARTLAGMIRDQNPVIADPQAFAQISVAARGFAGLEPLLFDPAIPATDYSCALTRALTADLDASAKRLEQGWQGGIDQLLLRAGEAGNTSYLSDSEARQTLFTQLVSGVEFNANQRIARPLGTVDRPRPERAEARLSGRSTRNIALSLRALRGLAVALAPDIPQSLTGFDAAIAQAEALDDPAFAGVAQAAAWSKADALRQQILTLRDTLLAELGPKLGVDTGFNATDGD